MIYADKRILLIDDQRPFLMLLRGLVNSLGATDVVICTNGEQAISSCRKQKFDVVVCDLHLGSDRKNGFELIEELRVKKLVKPTTVFLIISADSARPMVLGSIERQPDDYLIKPFSQAQLKNRIERSWQKRQLLRSVYLALDKDKLDVALHECEQIAMHHSGKHTLQLLIELYWKAGQTDKVAQLLADRFDEPNMPVWAQIAHGRNELISGNGQHAQEIAAGVLAAHRFSVEGYDLLAEAQEFLDQGENAVASIKQSIKLSPYSLQRHLVACRIAKSTGDYELLIEASLAIWKLSKRTIHHNVSHWCNYVRSILDAAENATEKNERNRYQQEAILVMHRAKMDENITKDKEHFDIDIYEQIMSSRLSQLDGKLLESKRQLLDAQFNIAERFASYPASLVPDTMKVFYALGEYEEINALVDVVTSNNRKLDEYTEQLIQYESKAGADNKDLYAKHNKQGIKLYQNGKFEEAREEFNMALVYAPMNTGVALNTLQCVVKILEKGGKPDHEFIQHSKRTYRLVSGMPLRAAHQEKFDALIDDLSKYLGV